MSLQGQEKMQDVMILVVTSLIVRSNDDMTTT